MYTASAWNQTDFFDPSYFIKFKEGLDDYFVHLPDEFGDDLNKYAATLGHKINHGWNHNYPQRMDTKGGRVRVGTRNANKPATGLRSSRAHTRREIVR